jgi:hypothetical protein
VKLNERGLAPVFIGLIIFGVISLAIYVTGKYEQRNDVKTEEVNR